MNFKIMNNAQVTVVNERIEMYAPKNTDFFFNNDYVSKEESITPKLLTNAPFYYQEITGNFIMRVKTYHEFKYVYDAASILVMNDTENWAKACAEMTDFGTHAVVSVVARNGESDDANGCDFEGNEVWLQVCRCEKSFAFHYSIDGKKFHMMRFFNLPFKENVKVGLVAQSPAGEGGKRFFSDISLEKKTVKNIRLGK